MQLFWKRGVLSVSSKDLAEAMGIQRSSFYNSFGSKDAVLSEALDYYGSIAPDRRLDAIQPGQPVMPEIRSFLAELCALRAADPEGRGCLVCNEICELTATDTEAGQRLRSMLQARIKQMRSLFEQAQRQNELSSVTPAEDLARAYVAFLIGLNVLSKVVRDKDQLWASCQSFLQGMGSVKV